MGTSTEQNPTHTYLSAGTYTVSLRIRKNGKIDDEIKIGYITVQVSGLTTTTTTAAVSTTTIPAETTTTIPTYIPPVANAGYDRSVQAGDTVLLDGSGSYAADGIILEYHWKQVSGVDVTLENENEAIASFVTENEGSYEFQLTVSDGILESSDTVLIEITEKTIELLSPGSEEEVFSRPTLRWDGKGCDGFKVFLSKDGKRFFKVGETADESYTVRPLQHFLFSTNKNNPLPIYWKVLGQKAGEENIWLESPTWQYYHIRKNAVLEKYIPWLFSMLNASS